MGTRDEIDRPCGQGRKGSASGAAAAVKDADVVAFLQRALPRMRMRWPGFRKVRGQVRKRLARRLRELGLETLDAYETYLGTHPREWSVLDATCRITISRFYRDRAVFDALRDPVLPGLGRAALAREEPAVRSWSAGCASGEEPYSLSLAWVLDAALHVPAVELEIVATEIDPGMLERARAGCYSRGSLKDLPREWVGVAFEPVGETLCLRPAFRERVELVRQDIREEMPPGPFDLVLCRNLVFTYFEPSLQALLLERMLWRLVPGGVLVVGVHETLPPGDWPLERPYGALPIHRLTEERSGGAAHASGSDGPGADLVTEYDAASRDGGGAPTLEQEEAEVTEDRIAELESQLASLQEEVLALRKRTGEMEQRLRRLEVREEILESPGAAGDAPVDYE